MRNTAVTSALINFLLADAALRALVPDGVFKDLPGPSMAHGGNATRFVVVSYIGGPPVTTFGGRSHTDTLYLVEAQMLSTAGGNVNAAAERLDDLLDPQPPAPPCALTVPGFGVMAVVIEEPTEATERDAADSSIVWTRAGGRYHVWTAPTRS
jgi:hypothetical protein